MIVKIDKGNYYLVKSDKGYKIKVKGDDRIYSQATEFKDQPREYEEVLNIKEELKEMENTEHD